MENNKKWQIPQEDIDKIEKLPLDEQISYWRNLYEIAMQSIQAIMETSLEKIIPQEKERYSILENTGS